MCVITFSVCFVFIILRTYSERHALMVVHILIGGAQESGGQPLGEKEDPHLDAVVERLGGGPQGREARRARGTQARGKEEVVLLSAAAK